MSTMSLVERITAEMEAFACNVTMPPVCPQCQAEECMRWDGFRNRCASFQVGAATVYVPRFRLRRVDCRNCKVSSTLYPPGVIPQRRYQLCVIEHAVGTLLAEPAGPEEYESPSQTAAPPVGRCEQAVALAHGCARRTVGRWLEWLSGLGPGALARRLLKVTGEPLLPSVAWAQQRTERARPAARWQLLSACAEVLSLLQALASATGLNPAVFVPEFAR
jgi:hypothetical protein